jgi:hypothetical protein
MACTTALSASAGMKAVGLKITGQAYTCGMTKLGNGRQEFSARDGMKRLIAGGSLTQFQIQPEEDTGWPIND